MANEPLELVRAIADILGNTGAEERAAVLANAWGETRYRAGRESREREVEEAQQSERAIGIQMEIARKQRDEAFRAGMEEAAKICDSADELLHGPSWCARRIRACIGNEELTP